MVSLVDRPVGAMIDMECCCRSPAHPLRTPDQLRAVLCQPLLLPDHPASNSSWLYSMRQRLPDQPVQVAGVARCAHLPEERFDLFAGLLSSKCHGRSFVRCTLSRLQHCGPIRPLW